MENKSINVRNLFITAGAFISYTVGAGFASGNEVLQFFGSWGFPESMLALVGAILACAIYCGFLFIMGQKVDFDRPSKSYFYFGGKALGWFIQIYVFIFIFGCFMLMFSGAGSLLNQQWGIPQWIGAVLMGIVSGVVVLGGLKTVENVLGSAGIIILAYVLVFSIISMVNPGSSLDQASGAAQAVADGKVWQANLFAMPPLSWIPGLASINNPFITGVLYSTMCLVSGFPFYFTLGKRSKSSREAGISGVVAACAFYLCVGFVLLIMLANFNSLINPATNEMYPFPVLAAIGAIWPAGSWTYVLIIFTGIFTTVSGYLWVIKDWFFPGEVMNNKARIFIVVLLVAGITLGGVIPFSALINFMFPLTGVVGLVITIAIVVKYFRTKDSDEPAPQIQENPEGANE